jgi:antitoxin component YwqK of YwqJK toxin-antitoxin module
MEKKTKSITITQHDYILRNVNDEEVDIQGHPNHYSEFDPDGRPLKEIRYNRQGEFEEMFEYGYDLQGNLERESYYPVENEVAEEKTFIRNDAGQLLRALKHYQDGSVDTITCEYDGSGQLTRRITTTDEGEVEQVETFDWKDGVLAGHQVFDEQGDLVPEPDDNAVKPNQTRVTHNEKGQVIKEEELDEEGEVYMTVSRSYDDDGLADEVEVFIDGRGQAISRHYFLKYEYTFFE